MMCKWKAVSLVAVMALAATPALATVNLSFVLQDTTIPVVGWGLDLNVANPGVADLDSFTIGPLWDPVGASIDGDLLGGTSLLGVGPGANILLATLTFEAFGLGTTPISLSVSGEEDEGFALYFDPGLDAVVFAEGTITVPEPATLALVALGGLAALRRRR